jgi:alginate O-acetyltransferase complex protein AlgI
MLFNSYEFVFLFLPVTLGGFTLLRGKGIARVVWLLAASIFFYGWWRLSALPILIASALFNYGCGQCIVWRRGRTASNAIIAFGVAADLMLLGYFKYAGFFYENACDVISTICPRLNIILPIGISFFTFTQIAYLVDAHRGKVTDGNLARYFLFVTYFPHLIAGPIFHHTDMMPQFRTLGERRISAERLAVGLTVFIVGLFKKVCLADTVATLVPAVFDARSSDFSSADAWVATIAYTLQIYFDFSGYSDMALGMSYLFGIRLPVNFNSPYQATNIIEFWRRWHMTLSAFLRDYLYIPLGGNRLGSHRRYANLMATMLLGGLWHGAGWTFVIWGGLHGVYLVINHGWRAAARRWDLPQVPPLAAWAISMMGVIVAWVFFRAPSTAVALSVIKKMFYLAPASDSGLASIRACTILIVLAAIAVFCPNMQRLMPSSYYLGSIDKISRQWSPSIAWALAVTCLAIVSVVFVSRESVFLYFQF